ncbi:hypothetical protein BaRGS_00006045 [Batillaria attramentaria]|uniref:BZIP domain-containing protein n=1 Tax=Batillaria attramentaria TaxID=370345 RepID=A0ABD0LTC7_9CAEN
MGRFKSVSVCVGSDSESESLATPLQSQGETSLISMKVLSENTKLRLTGSVWPAVTVTECHRAVGNHYQNQPILSDGCDCSMATRGQPAAPPAAPAGPLAKLKTDSAKVSTLQIRYAECVLQQNVASTLSPLTPLFTAELCRVFSFEGGRHCDLKLQEQLGIAEDLFLQRLLGAVVQGRMLASLGDRQKQRTITFKDSIMLGQSLGLDNNIWQLLLPSMHSCSEENRAVIKPGEDAKESTKTAAEIPVTNFGYMTHPDDFMGLNAQSSFPDSKEKGTVFEDITPAEELPEHVDMSEYMNVFQRDLHDRALVLQAPGELAPTQPEPALDVLPDSGQTPAPDAPPRLLPKRPRLGGVSSFSTDNGHTTRPRLGGISASASGLDTVDSNDIAGDSSVFDDADLDKLTRDPRLQEAVKRCKGTRSLQPLLKEELRLKILARRHGNGQGDLEVCFKEPPQYPMTAEECRKRDVRRAQNRGAAQRFRQRKRSREEELKQKVDEGQKRNKELLSEVETLRRETTRLRGILDRHLASGGCLLSQQDTFFFPDIPDLGMDMTSLCQLISAEEVDGRPAFSP